MTSTATYDTLDAGDIELTKRRHATRGDANDYLTQTLPTVTSEANAEAIWELRRMIAIVEAWQSANRPILDENGGEEIRILLEPPDDWDHDPSAIYLAAKYRLTMLTHPDLHRLDKDWLRACRDGHDINARDLAKHLKVNVSTINRWETGVRDVSGTNHRKLRLFFVPLWEAERANIAALLIYRAIQRTAAENGDNPFIGLEINGSTITLNWEEIDAYLDHEDIIEGQAIHRRVQSFINLYNARAGIPRPPWVDATDPTEEAGFGKPRNDYWTPHVRQKYRMSKIDQHLGSGYSDGRDPVADNGSGNL